MSYLIFPIAGAKFRPLFAKDALLSAPIGTPLLLQPEPTNLHDNLAIKIIIPSTAIEDEIETAAFIGYVPRTHNLELHNIAHALGKTVDALAAILYSLNGLYSEVLAGEESAVAEMEAAAKAGAARPGL